MKQPTPSAGGEARAVIYLRVSTAKQADKDVDPEGYSLPAQREACRRKAEQLGAIVVDEYIDRGESAKSADRPALQAMLARVTTALDVTYVVVHKVDRLARSRADDVAIGLAIKSAGARLVSVTENIDDTPSGKLLHGIMASIAEFYSQNLSTEILKGSVQKAKSGGTPFLAPLGYVNARQVHDGREIRTIELDPERAPLISWAFEAYATGLWNLHTLLEDLTDRGLTNRPGPNRPERPMHLSRLHKLLRNPYYMGIVAYRGEAYPGRHTPLVTPEVFDRVQAVLTAHNQSGEKYRVHDHYLKGTLYCSRCGSRVTVGRFRGKQGGLYDYFFCLGRQSRRKVLCDLPYLPVEQVEVAVARYWKASVALPSVLAEEIRRDLEAQLSRERHDANGKVETVRHRIEQIDRRRGSWAEKAIEGTVPDDIARQKQNELSGQLVRARADLARAHEAAIDIRSGLAMALELVRDCGAAYSVADPGLRRQWNQAFFTRLNLDADDVVDATLRTPFDVLVGPSRITDTGAAKTSKAPAERGPSRTHPLLHGVGLSNEPLVGCSRN